MQNMKDFRKIRFGCMEASKEEREFPEHKVLSMRFAVL